MPAPSTSPLNLRLTAEQRRAVDELAARERVSAEQAVMQAVEQALRQPSEAAELPEGTPFYGLGEMLSGVGDGPQDLSTNASYLADLGSREGA
jgi:hypothetical protein